MLEADSVSIKFGNRTILSGCYISCKPGETVGLLGRNGSGKSTLLKIIFGSIKADFKHIRIDDKIINRGFADKSIAYLPQQGFLPSYFKVKEITSKLSKNYLPTIFRAIYLI